MPLEEYAKKRNFSKTPEPAAKVKNAGKRLIYVIQRHQATRLHYDLRLERNGVLLSWAIPKEPSSDPAVKRLAMQTEDHPIDYAKFHGTIPEGYGAGKVEIWDSGYYEMIEFSDKTIVADIHGKKLNGKYVLIKTGFQKKGWLFFRKKE